MRLICKGCILSAIGAAALFSATGPTPGASPLEGKWSLDKDNSVELTIGFTGDNIQFRETRSGKTLSEYSCDTKGVECSAKEEGHGAKVTVWFNGPKLVEILTRGGEVVRRRYSVDNDGAKLQVEVSPMSSAGKTEVLTFKRE